MEIYYSSDEDMPHEAYLPIQSTFSHNIRIVDIEANRRKLSGQNYVIISDNAKLFAPNRPIPLICNASIHYAVKGKCLKNKKNFTMTTNNPQLFGFRKKSLITNDTLVDYEVDPNVITLRQNSKPKTASSSNPLFSHRSQSNNRVKIHLSQEQSLTKRLNNICEKQTKAIKQAQAQYKILAANNRDLFNKRDILEQKYLKLQKEHQTMQKQCETMQRMNNEYSTQFLSTVNTIQTMHHRISFLKFQNGRAHLRIKEMHNALTDDFLHQNMLCFADMLETNSISTTAELSNCCCVDYVVDDFGPLRNRTIRYLVNTCASGICRIFYPFRVFASAITRFPQERMTTLLHSLHLE